MIKYDKPLLFDADNTLLDLKRTEKMALNQTFRKYGVHPTQEILALYDEINHALWKDFEDGLIDKETVITTRFRILFMDLELNIDPVAFERDYQLIISCGIFH